MQYHLVNAINHGAQNGMTISHNNFDSLKRPSTSPQSPLLNQSTVHNWRRGNKLAFSLNTTDYLQQKELNEMKIVSRNNLSNMRLTVQTPIYDGRQPPNVSFMKS